MAHVVAADAQHGHHRPCQLLRHLRGRTARAGRPGRHRYRRAGVVLPDHSGNRAFVRDNRVGQPFLGRRRARLDDQSRPGVDRLCLHIWCSLGGGRADRLPVSPPHTRRLAACGGARLAVPAIRSPGAVSLYRALGDQRHISRQGRRPRADGDHGYGDRHRHRAGDHALLVAFPRRHKRHRHRLAGCRHYRCWAVARHPEAIGDRRVPVAAVDIQAGRIGIPACVNDLAWVGGNFMLFVIFARTPDPTSCQASWAVGLKCEEMIACMPMYAFAMAVATIVGQNLGAGQPDRAELAGWQVAGTGVLLNTVFGLALFFGAAPIAHLMSNNPAVIGYATQYFQVVSFCEPFVAAWLILFGAMQGAGYTRWPMIVTLVCLTGVRLSLAWLLTINFAMGPTGTWLSLSTTSIMIGLLAIWRFKTGVWKHQKV